MYWPSRQRSSKRLIVLLEPKSEGARRPWIGAPHSCFRPLHPPLSNRYGTIIHYSSKSCAPVIVCINYCLNASLSQWNLGHLITVNCQLPICKYVCYKRSFIVRCLFNDYVWKFSCCISLILLLFYFSFFIFSMCVWHMVMKDYLLTYLLETA